MKRLLNKSWFISVVLFGISLLSRIPFHDRILFFWDSGDFALALERFDLAKQQPHPPGYLFYILLARLFNVIFQDANNALVAMSIFGGAISVVLIFLIGQSIFNRKVGITAAILLLFSPLAWFYSEVALTHAVELPVVLAAIWCLYQMYYFRRYSIATAILIGLAAGIRQDILLFLGPFFLFASIKFGYRHMLLSWAAMGIAMASWLIPILVSVGGITNLRFLYANQFDIAIRPSSILAIGLRAVVQNGKELIKESFWLLGLTILVPVFLAAKRLKPDRRIFFLMLLMMPAILFFLLMQTYQPSYTVSYIAPLVLIVAYMLVLASNELTKPGSFFSRHWQASSNLMLASFVVFISVFHIYFFSNGLSTNENVSMQGYTSMFSSYTVRGLRNSGDNMLALLTAVKQFDPEKTVIVCNLWGNPEDWRRLMYYLPDYQVVGLDETNSMGSQYSVASHHNMSVQQGTRIALSPEVTQALFIELTPESEDIKSIEIGFPGDGSVRPMTLTSLSTKTTLHVGSYSFYYPQ